MTSFVLALGLILISDAGAALPVRLAPVECSWLADADLRALLKVELRERFVDRGASAAGDVLLVSVDCDARGARILAVRQDEGPPLRRRLAMAGPSAPARERQVAVAIAELLRETPMMEAAVPEPASPPPSPSLPPLAPAPAGVVAKDADDPDEGPLTRLDLAEPLLMMPLAEATRIGFRTRGAHIELPGEIPQQKFYVLSVEPLLDLAVGRGVVATFSVPVAWATGSGQERGGELANLTAGLRYVTGGKVRLGASAALSLNVGDTFVAHGESNLFELDRFRDDTYSLRVGTSALWRSGRLSVQGELAALFLADDPGLGTLMRGGIGAGMGFGSGRSSTVLGIEYLVITDLFERYFRYGDRFVQTLVGGGRWAVSSQATLGLHLQIALDQGENLQPAGVFSFARAF